MEPDAKFAGIVEQISVGTNSDPLLTAQRSHEIPHLLSVILSFSMKYTVYLFIFFEVWPKYKGLHL